MPPKRLVFGHIEFDIELDKTASKTYHPYERSMAGYDVPDEATSLPSIRPGWMEQ